MIQFNLLPDVKIQYIKAKRARRLVTLVAVFATAGSLIILMLTVSIKLYQAKRLNDLNNDIAANSKTLSNIPQLDKILTVQNQLNSLTGLHDSKLATARVFDYLNEVTPAQAKISNFNIDYVANTVSITGTADSLGSVNKYVDTLKFTDFSGQDVEKTRAFKDVVLASFAVNDGGDASERATYNITMAYDPLIFDNTKTVKLSVPTIVTTRSEVAKPTDLFTQQAVPDETKKAGN